MITDISFQHDRPELQNSTHAVAVELEVSFLAEMLRYSGVGKTPDLFGGGAGEDHFAPMLADHYARSLVHPGGTGLAEHIAASLIKAGQIE